MNLYGVVMAGGGGQRFWPLSRKNNPKQFLNLTGRGVMLGEALSRLEGLCKEKRLFVVTNSLHRDKVREVTSLPAENILSEPEGRNTAPCIGYAAVNILKKYGDGVMIVTPSDAYIRDEEEFSNVLKTASAAAAKEDAIVTIGIRPDYPATGYGYILCKEAPQGGKICQVDRFVEKPDRARAEEFLKNERYLWNSGMFLFRISYVLGLFQKYLPKVYEGLMQIEASIGTKEEEEVLKSVYPTLLNVSFDYGIMEKTEKVLCVEGNFGWSDLGSFEALSVVHQSDECGNIILGDSALIDTKGCVILSDKKLVAAIGISDLVAVETDDALLLCTKDRAQEIKKIVELLRTRGREDLL